MSSGQLSLKQWIAGWSNDEFPQKKDGLLGNPPKSQKKTKQIETHVPLPKKKSEKTHDPLTKF